MTPAESESPDTSRWTWIVLAVLLALAATLRFYHLDSQLWLDEVSALRGYRKPFLETLTTFPIFFPNPLYELMAHTGILVLGESAWAIRFPAALFGVAGVLAFYALSRRCLPPASATLAAFLLAASYHHVFFSQDARGYTTYLFFAILATERLLALLERMRRTTAAAYIVLAALATYAHPFGLFVLAGQMPVALAVTWMRRRRGETGGPTIAHVIWLSVLSGLAVATLFAPLIPDALRYVLGEARTPSHGPRVTSLLPELLAGLRAGFGGWAGVITGAVLGSLGTLLFVRRQPVAFALLATPLAVSAFTIIALDAGVHPRYFLLALPLGYMVAAHTAMPLVRWITRSVIRLSARRAATVEFGAGLAIVVIACVPLLRYYRVPKQDYLGAIRELERLAGPEDRVVAIAHAGFAMRHYYDPDFTVASDLDELRSIEGHGNRVWLMVTLENPLASGTPDLFAHLRSDYKRVTVLPGTIGDGAIRIYVRDATPEPATPDP